MYLLLKWCKCFPCFLRDIQRPGVVSGLSRSDAVFLRIRKVSVMNIEYQRLQTLTSLRSLKNAYGSSVAFFSFFFSCSRCSAAVSKENPPDADAPDRLFFPLPVDLPLGLELNFLFSSSSVTSSKETIERREEAEERDDDDRIDLASTSESEGTIKSSSSDALDRDLRATFRISRLHAHTNLCAYTHLIYSEIS